MKKIVKGYICETCDKKYTPKAPHQKYCSKKCITEYYKEYNKKYHKEHYKKNPILKKRICEVCGKKYTPTKRNQKYCSYKCKEIVKSICLKKSQQKYYENEKKKKASKNKSNCSICKSTKNIENHHIQDLIDNGEKTIPLCKICHKTITKYHRKIRTLGYKIFYVGKNK